MIPLRFVLLKQLVDWSGLFMFRSEPLCLCSNKLQCSYTVHLTTHTHTHTPKPPNTQTFTHLHTYDHTHTHTHTYSLSHTHAYSTTHKSGGVYVPQENECLLITVLWCT